jgi:NADH-quinone oxidoreductase subunit F
MGCIIGSGGLNVLNNGCCMVELARESLAATKTAACGKCVLCREGTSQMLEILTDITAAKESLKILNCWLS